MSYGETITRTDLTNILNSILPQSSYIQSWEYVGDVYWWGNTWTVPDDGFIEVYVEPSAANWYWRISDSKAHDTGWSHRLTGANGLTVSQEFFVKKGAVLGTYDMNAINTAHVYYYKFTLKETIPEPAADYIVEQGTSGKWTYRKWNSGIQEAWAVSSDSFAITSGININQYYGSKSYNISALGFTAIHNIQITGGGGGAYFASKVESFNTSTINMSARASNTYTTTLTHWFYVKGTWK